MFQGIKNGGTLIKESIKAFIRHPQMLVPLLMCWLIYAPVLVAVKFHVPWEEFDSAQKILIIFLIILLFSVIISWATFVLLELIRQIETSNNSNIFKALKVSIANTMIALPIVITWAVIWFVITIIESLFRRNSDDDENIEYNAENVAKTVAGFEEFSLSAAFFDALRKGVRMLAFIIYPAIAWENLGTSSSIKKGWRIAKKHKIEFVSGFMLTELAAIIVFLPPCILFYISSEFEVDFPDIVWFGTMIYCAFAWSFSLFLEQMFVAELYLWHLIWEKEVINAKENGHDEPKLADVKRPSIMDNIADLHLTNVP